MSCTLSPSDYERALSKCQIVQSKASLLVGDCHEMQFTLTYIKKNAAISK